MNKGILLSFFNNKQIFEKPVVFATNLLFLLCLITLRFSLNFRRLKFRLLTCAFAIPILSFAGNVLHIHWRPLPVLMLLTPNARKSYVEDLWGRDVIKFLSVEHAPYVARYSFESCPNAVALRLVYRMDGNSNGIIVCTESSFLFSCFTFFWKENVWRDYGRAFLLTEPYWRRLCLHYNG